MVSLRDLLEEYNKYMEQVNEFYDVYLKDIITVTTTTITVPFDKDIIIVPSTASVPIPEEVEKEGCHS